MSALDDGVVSFDITVEVENAEGSGVFVELEKITNVTPPNASVADVDITHQKSPGRARQFKPGLTDYGTWSCEGNWVPRSVTDLFIDAWRASGETRSTRLTYPDGETDTFPSYPQAYEKTTPLGEKLGFTLTAKVAGNVVSA